MRIILLITSFFLTATICGQSKVLTGKIIREDFARVALATILTSDTVILTTTDINGDLVIKVPIGTKDFQISHPNYKPTRIFLNQNCNNIEIILLFYHSKTRIKKIPKLHKLAFNKNIFEAKKPCFKYK